MTRKYEDIELEMIKKDGEEKAREKRIMGKKLMNMLLEKGMDTKDLDGIREWLGYYWMREE
jgi:hypothetical protein